MHLKSFLSLLIILCSIYSSHAQEVTRKIKTTSVLVDMGGNHWVHQNRPIILRPQSDFIFQGYRMTSRPGLQVGLLWNFKLGEHISLRTGWVLFSEHRHYETEVETQTIVGNYRNGMPLKITKHQYISEIPIMAEIKYKNFYFVGGVKKHITNFEYNDMTSESGDTWKGWSKGKMYPLLAVSPSLKVEYQFDKIKNIRAYTGVDYRYFGRTPLEVFYQIGFCIPIINQ